MIGTTLECIGFLSQQTEGKWEVTEWHEKKPKRSLSANAYAWVLITKIAESMTPPQSKELVYLEMLKRYGQSEFVSVLSSIDVKGYFKYYEEYGKGHVEGREFTHYKVFKGSSEFDVREMQILIEGIVQEAKDLGIETMTPQEISQMLAEMREKPSEQ